MAGKYRLIAWIFTASLVATLLVLGTRAQQEAFRDGFQQLRWATSSVGSAGHRAKLALAGILQREIPGLRIEVMPTAGAMASLRGFALGQFDGYYGADIAFRELATDSGRFTGFQDRVQVEPVQVFWAYTLELALATRARDPIPPDWASLAGRALFTGPAAWDVRAHMDLALATLGVEYRYRELDLGLAGSALAAGSVDAMVIYTAGETTPAGWVAEAELATELRAINPSKEEIARLRASGLEVLERDSVMYRGGLGVERVVLLPFYYGFHLGTAVSADTVVRMLEVIESHATELALIDPVFAQVAADMTGLQRRGVSASVAHARVHPGLAQFLKQRGAWDTAWDDRVAEDTR